MAERYYRPQNKAEQIFRSLSNILREYSILQRVKGEEERKNFENEIYFQGLAGNQPSATSPDQLMQVARSLGIEVPTLPQAGPTEEGAPSLTPSPQVPRIPIPKSVTGQKGRELFFLPGLTPMQQEERKITMPFQVKKKIAPELGFVPGTAGHQEFVTGVKLTDLTQDERYDRGVMAGAEKENYEKRHKLGKFASSTNLNNLEIGMNAFHRDNPQATDWEAYQAVTGGKDLGAKEYLDLADGVLSTAFPVVTGVSPWTSALAVDPEELTEPQRKALEDAQLLRQLALNKVPQLNVGKIPQGNTTGIKNYNPKTRKLE